MIAQGKNSIINYSVSALGLLCALSSANIHAGAMGPTQITMPGKAYIGVFGGGGTSNRVDISQYGTAFFPEILGGPLAVNSFGRTDSRDVGIVGGHVGYQWMELSLNPLGTQWSLSPAAELEGYYLGKSSFTGHDVSNNTVRLDEHDFLVTYPLSTGVFLANAILNFNPANYVRWHPYVGAGIGAAVLDISNADSLQVAPLEAGVNHYNANPSDTEATFAGQVKVGLNFDLSEHINIFAEYRGLYLADTTFIFGSTVYPAHAETNSWIANLGHQYYNLGAIGINFSI